MASEILCGYCGTPNQPTENFCENCGAELNVVPPPPAPLPAPTLLNQRYRVLNRLGSGGFGTVYKVQDTQLNNRLLAAKKLELNNIPPKDHQDAINNFKQEANILASLRHPNLPHIYEHFVENSDYYLVMDFIEGETLEHHLQGLKSPIMPIEKTVKLCTQLANVLEYLHARQPQIIFRDLKPANIMFTSSREVYLIDFGIARHFKPGQARDTVRMGTLEYIAPEQLSGKQTSVSSDIYSFGVVLHELLSGNVPVYPPQFALLKLAGAPQASLSKLVMRMLEREPQSRPASAAEVKHQLQQILQDLQHPTNPGSAQSQPAAKSAPPTRILPKASVPQKPLLPPVPKVRGELLHTYAQHHAAIYTLAWSPDGSKLASAGEDCQVCVWQALTGKTIFTYQKHTGSVHALAWSPSSKYVASAGNDHTVQIWQAQDGQSFSTYQGHRRWVQALSWSPDAKLMASGDANGQVHLWNPRTGQQHLTYQQHHASIYALSFSPDGTLLASGDEDGAIHVWESAGLSLRALCTIHQRKISALAWSPDGTLIASSSEDRKDHALHIWQATTGTQVAAYAAHQRMVNALAWSPTNKRLASAGRDQTVQILDPQTGNTLFTYRGHTSSINALAWSPDGNTLASAGDEHAVQVWWAN